MAKREIIIDLSYHYEDSTAYKEGTLDVGISAEIEKFFRLYAKQYGGDDDIRDAVFDTIIIELLGRYCKFYATNKAKKIYKKIVALIQEELK